MVDVKMDVSRDALKEKYKLITKNCRPGQKRDELRTSCFQFLEGTVGAFCFKLLPFADIQRDYLERATKKGDAEFRHLIKLLQLFEKYAASILAKPWCKDYYAIKVYTGFFKYNFEKWISLDVTCQVFKLIGYMNLDDTLTLEAPVDEDRVLSIGFELYLAHTQLYMFESTKYLSSEYAMKDIITGWLGTTGNPNNVLHWLEEHKLEKHAASAFGERHRFSAEVPVDKTRFKSVDIDSHYDKNGASINIPAKHHPGKIGLNEFDEHYVAPKQAANYYDKNGDSFNNPVKHHPGLMGLHEIDEHYVALKQAATYCDKNVDSVNSRVRYPPGCEGGEYSDYGSSHLRDVNQALHSQRDEIFPEDGSLSSMRTVDIPDSDMYGGGNQGDPQNSTTTSDHLNRKVVFPSPYSSHGPYGGGDQGDPKSPSTTSDRLNREAAFPPSYSLHGDSNLTYPATEESSNWNSGGNFRGGNYENIPFYENVNMGILKYDHGIIYENITEDLKSDENLLKLYTNDDSFDQDVLKQKKERFDKMLHNRIQTGETKLQRNPVVNKNSAYGIHDGGYVGANTAWNDLQPRIDEHIDHKTPSQGSLTRRNFSGTRNYTARSSDSCRLCGRPPAIGCINCKKIACKDCGEIMFRQENCLEGFEHARYQISRV